MGRPRGSRNNPKQALIALLKEKYPNYQPVMEMAKSALELTSLAEEAKTDPELWMQAATAHDKVAQYVTPKLKAMEITGEAGEPIRFIVEKGFPVHSVDE